MHSQFLLISLRPCHILTQSLLPDQHGPPQLVHRIAARLGALECLKGRECRSLGLQAPIYHKAGEKKKKKRWSIPFGKCLRISFSALLRHAAGSMFCRWHPDVLKLFCKQPSAYFFDQLGYRASLQTSLGRERKKSTSIIVFHPQNKAKLGVRRRVTASSVLLPKNVVRSIKFSSLSWIFYWENSFFRSSFPIPVDIQSRAESGSEQPDVFAL